MLGKFIRRKPRRIYLDHAAATPLQPSVMDCMREVEREHFANPSAIHREGVKAREVVEEARENLARCLKVRPEHVVFTGSGTESNNLAVIGTLYARHAEGIPYEEMEIITTAIEHPSISETMAFAESLGVTVRKVAVDEEGLVQLDSLEAKLSEKTVLVTLAYINSEIGVVQLLGKIARLLRKYEKEHGLSIYFHTDAAQAPYWQPCQFDTVSVEMMSLDAGKCGGPKGVGVLAFRHGVKIKPVLFGGPQEFGLRPATENVVGIVGAVEAIVKAQAECEKTSQKVGELRDRLLSGLLKIEGVVLNGGRSQRVANNINVSVPGVDSEFLTISLDEAGVSASTKSACSGAGGGGSKVVEAVTGDAARAVSTLRLTLGPDTSESDIDLAAKRIIDIITKLQAQHQQHQHQHQHSS